MWQFKCAWCGEMSDCFDSKDERDKAIADHRCGSEALYDRIMLELDVAEVAIPKGITLDDLAQRIMRCV
jgi:DNA-directed RNA polymerase subunit RPC12/RpoP